MRKLRTEDEASVLTLGRAEDSFVLTFPHLTTGHEKLRTPEDD